MNTDFKPELSDPSSFCFDTASVNCYETLDACFIRVYPCPSVVENFCASSFTLRKSSLPVPRSGKFSARKNWSARGFHRFGKSHWASFSRHGGSSASGSLCSTTSRSPFLSSGRPVTTNVCSVAPANCELKNFHPTSFAAMEQESGLLTGRDFNHRCRGLACDMPRFWGFQGIFPFHQKTRGNTPV